MDWPEDDRRRQAAIIIYNAVREWRGLIARALREAIGYRRQLEEPHMVEWRSRAALRHDGASPSSADPRYYVMVTDEEMAAIWAVLKPLGHAAGWDSFPIDIYHD